MQERMASAIIPLRHGHPLRSVVHNACYAGAIPIGCIGLRLVGFNDKLYNYFVNKPTAIAIPNNNVASSAKRKHESEPTTKGKQIKREGRTQQATAARNQLAEPASDNNMKQ